MLLSNAPITSSSFLWASFTEKLDYVEFPKSTKKKFKKESFKKYLDREMVWYGKSGKDRLTAAKYQKLKYQTLIKELNPALLILGNGNHAGDMILKDVAIENEVPIVYIERGALPNSWHIDEFGITAGTKIAQKSISEIQLTDNKSYLRYKPYYLKSRVTWWPQPAKKDKIDIKEQFGIKEEQKLILFANQLNNDTSNFLYNPLFDNNLEAFKWLCENLRRNKDFDYFVFVKKHPHHNGDGTAFESALSENGLNGKWVSDIPLFECIEQSDFVCAVNSTMLFEAMIYEKPVLQMGNSILSKKNIVYHLKERGDYKLITDWLQAKEFDLKQRNFELFMSHLIDSELCFYFEEVLNLKLNGDDFFVHKALKYVNKNKQGGLPVKFLRLNKQKNLNIKKILKSKIIKIKKKLFK